jgi:serine/threonine protein phosphatase PrpC
VASSAGSGNGPLRGHGLLAKLGWALRSDAGHGRPRNEDFAGVFAPTTPDDAWDRGPLFVVCDGRGDHGAGAVASRTAVEAALAEWTGPDPARPAVAIRAAASAANDAVCAAARTRGQPGMATTFTALTLAGREAVIVHLGYSRCYLVRGGMCTQLTADHGLVEETWSEVAPGLEPPGLEPPGLEPPGLEPTGTEPPGTEPPGLEPPGLGPPDRRPQLLGAPGSEGAVQVDLFMVDTEAGDVFVLCSDGLSRAVTPGEIAEWAGAVGTPAAPTVVEAAEELVDMALEEGASDNVTVLVVKVTTNRAVPPMGSRRPFFRRDRRWRAFTPPR